MPFTISGIALMSGPAAEAGGAPPRPGRRQRSADPPMIAPSVLAGVR